MTIMPAISVAISKDGTIVIPEKLRKALNWVDGQSVVLRQTGEGILLEKPSNSPLRAKAKALVRQAKINTAIRADTLTADEARAHYDAAVTAIRKTLQAKRHKKSKSA